ncbi:hypothetical protein SLEP1_g15267 [Rubroshorea leprosula]|uniref:Uncharacterized protein n=1 Tax=Rubroshorea leprosula TaxID=152421 RepID=A0AAV5ILU2_9ROSI|nr:hypothetical protein SLEP1_g15267 [Rubroshorea leprosula]
MNVLLSTESMDLMSASAVSASACGEFSLIGSTALDYFFTTAQPKDCYKSKAKYYSIGLLEE